MKALTIWQPWATLLARGPKRYETRSWRTSYTGLLAIHSAKREPRDGEYLQGGVQRALEKINRDNPLSVPLPLGTVLAVADLTGCTRITPSFRAQVETLERRIGDWRQGRYAWGLDVLWTPEEPIPARGQQRLWEWEPEPGTLPMDLEATSGRG